MHSVTFTAHNDVTLLHCGAEFFPALIAAIDAARHEVYLETYIFAADEVGDRVQAALMRAARRGVRIDVVTDWLGTGPRQCNALKKKFREAGVNYRCFNPWFRRGVARTHRKICIVDRALAFLGGLNINHDLVSDDGSRMTLPAPRWDFAIKIVGPLVDDIHREAQAQWARLGPLILKLRLELFRETRSSVATPPQGPVLAALVVRDNLRHRRTIQRAYLKALAAAQKSAWLANPYFAPNRKLRDALSSAALRGVDVTLLLGVGQFRIQDAVTQSFYPKLLKHGVKIVEYRKTQLHGKVAVVDDDWATVGSSNYDGLSLFVNQEANIVLKDVNFSHKLRDHIQRGIAEGVQVNPDDFANIPWYRRALYGLAYWFYKSVLSLITLGRYTE